MLYLHRSYLRGALTQDRSCIDPPILSRARRISEIVPVTGHGPHGMRILANSSRIDSKVDTLGSYMRFPIHEHEFGMSIRLRLRSSSPMAFLIVRRVPATFSRVRLQER